MKAKIASITAALFFIVLVACKKEGAGPKIHFKLKSLNATSFNPGDQVKFTFEFIPKTTENDTLFVVREFYTCFGFQPDTIKNVFPEFNATTKGELIFSYAYQSGGSYNGCPAGSTFKTDSLHYRFWIKDGDGNVSDTIKSPKVILYK